MHGAYEKPIHTKGVDTIRAQELKLKQQFDAMFQRSNDFDEEIKVTNGQGNMLVTH